MAQASVHWLRCSWCGGSYKEGAVRCLLALRWSELLSVKCSLRAYPQRVFWLGRRDVSERVRVSLCLGAGCPGCVLCWSDGPLVNDQRRICFVSQSVAAWGFREGSCSASKLKYRYKKGTRTLKPSISSFKPA